MTLDVAVRKRLGPAFALDVAFTAPPGITMLFGASGSGKTTLLRCLAGLSKPDSGRIAIGDRVLFDSKTGVNADVQDRHVGYVFQQAALFPHMSLRENIEYGLHRVSAEERRQRVSTIAESFHIAAMRNDSASVETRRVRSPADRRCTPYSMFSRSDMCGKSAAC